MGISTTLGGPQFQPQRQRCTLDPRTSAAPVDRVDPPSVACREIGGPRGDYAAAVALALEEGKVLMDPATFEACPEDLLVLRGQTQETVGWLSTPDGASTFSVGIVGPNGSRRVEQWANVEQGAVVLNCFVMAEPLLPKNSVV